MEDRCDLLCVDAPRAEEIREALLEDGEARKAADRARAFADPTRLTLAAALREGEELCVCDLSWISGRKQALVSHHLRTLRSEGLVVARRDGKLVMYSLTEEGRSLLRAVLGEEDGGRLVSSQQVWLSGARRTPKAEEREKFVRRAKLLAWAGVGWHGIEASTAVGAGLVAGSVALIGFGADSLIESVAGIILLWRFATSRVSSEDAERSAQKLIALSFYLIAAYVGFEAISSLVTGERPEASWIGIGLSVVTLLTMPPLAIAKRRIGEALGSSSTKSEAQENMLCAYLSAALLVGLGANALFGLWWADPITALLIAGVAVKEGCESWRGESCCTTPGLPDEGGCEDDCCRM